MSERFVTGLEQAWEGILDTLSALPAGEKSGGWLAATPCPEWTVFDVAAHLGALESQFQGLSQPDVPEDPSGGIDAWTAAGVVARRDWSPADVIAEIRKASTVQLERLRALDEAGWEEPAMGPLGETTQRGLAEFRIFDVYLHLLDIRAGLGVPLAPEREPVACEVCVDRAVNLTPWGAVKKAGITDDVRIRLDLAGIGGRTLDVVLEGGRGRIEDPADAPTTAGNDLVTGTALAYLVAVTGRPGVVQAAGGVYGVGPAATRLLEGYRVFG
ncbi:MAG TPA: maleylpyruvate isomerase family mycothiol-dependent enzyme [Acidimicrobiia bacterium]|nr:maleylpyruvate isomerase family mycothiol-dependent enzyme [Acidimicrobiia bacterium]